MTDCHEGGGVKNPIGRLELGLIIALLIPEVTVAGARRRFARVSEREINSSIVIVDYLMN